MNTAQNYYVYSYIDPRKGKGKEFYYGKGKDRRKWAHLPPKGKSETDKTIRRIQAAGKEPIIRVIAAGLTEDQALLIEAALIWKMGEELTNKIAGHYTAKFRPQNTLDKELEGFDFSYRSHFFNVGEYSNHEDCSDYRAWDDCYKFGFLSTGFSPQKKEQAQQLHKGDIVLAYISSQGYVGIGKVTAPAVPAREFRIGRKSLKQIRHKLKAKKMCHNYDDLDECEYVVKVKWKHWEKREQALKAIKKKGHYVARQIRASLEDQPTTRHYIQKEWEVDFSELLEKVKS
jgi:hypothetical protein